MYVDLKNIILVELYCLLVMINFCWSCNFSESCTADLKLTFIWTWTDTILCKAIFILVK